MRVLFTPTVPPGMLLAGKKSRDRQGSATGYRISIRPVILLGYALTSENVRGSILGSRQT